MVVNQQSVAVEAVCYMVLTALGCTSQILHHAAVELREEDIYNLRYRSNLLFRSKTAEISITTDPMKGVNFAGLQ